MNYYNIYFELTNSSDKLISFLQNIKIFGYINLGELLEVELLWENIKQNENPTNQVIIQASLLQILMQSIVKHEDQIELCVYSNHIYSQLSMNRFPSQEKDHSFEVFLQINTDDQVQVWSKLKGDGSLAGDNIHTLVDRVEQQISFYEDR
ncbi:hypothetical protein TTHERM_00848100 (macronuclear) [Tetrahymena thermophila SB210]|uniref:Uncharacterized protein n=1 Tax=Tetrahymena thermophila (strain SB210) TaxID=312017 RepID=Q22UR9_TETTS|nr:hypothetical protein TTHERM_00848100 [Tetrahymena thermophila SB210]EAR89057.1 hypothetical protein TTHERM_00848100 [Tetrahymena thermophila SB210]|eukprot:XP_001009302.1 hypothetical protein TTHERM_00848100 [Tetrahymena thermophila SB210]